MSKNIISQSEFVNLMTQGTTLSKNEAEQFLKTFFDTIENALLEGDSIKIKGFGTFKLRWVEEQIDDNQRNEDKIQVEGHNKVVFEPESHIKELINEPFAFLEPIEFPLNKEKNASEITENEVSDNSENPDEKLQPLRVFEEEAEKIKEIINEINALSPGKEINKTNDQIQNVNDENTEPKNNLGSEANSTIQEQEEKKPDEIESKTPEKEDTKNAIPDEDEYLVQENDKDKVLLENKNTDNQENDFDFNNTSLEEKVQNELTQSDEFDVIRDISERIGNKISEKENISETQKNEPETIEDALQATDKNENNINIESLDRINIIENEENTKIDDETKNVGSDIEENKIDESQQNFQEVQVEGAAHDNSTEINENEATIFLENQKEPSNHSEEIEIEPAINNLTDIYFKNEDHPQNESEKLNLDSNQVLNDEELYEKPKNRTFLNVILILIGIAIISWFVYNFFQKKVETARNNKRLEMIADSTAQALKIKQIKESLEKQKIDSIRRDSIKIKNLERQKAIIDSLNSLNLSPKKSDKEINEKSNEKSNLSNKPLSKNIFSEPRNYTEFLASEKLVTGSKLAQYAKKYYGNAYFWVYIYEANRSIIKDPNKVPLGITVKIPKVDSRLIDPKNKECLNYALGLQSKYLK